LADLTGAAGTWLVCDNTYEQFLFSGKQHFAINAPNIVHVFSFSKVHATIYLLILHDQPSGSLKSYW
jgi:aspartate/methionine/tyrosine aminotransferase